MKKLGKIITAIIILNFKDINRYQLLALSNNIQHQMSNNLFNFKWERLPKLFLLVIFILIFLGYYVLIKRNRELTKSAYYDHLTGAYNLVYFNQLSKQSFKHDPNCCVVALNIHQFKYFNEVFGYDQGDRLLCHVKKVLESNIETDEIFCRDAADQFYLFLKEVNSQVIKIRLEKIMDEIVQSDDLIHTNYYLKVHCGVAISNHLLNPEITFDTLMVRVMFALAKAKEKYLNSIWFFDEQLHVQEKLDIYIESHMRQALADGEFQFYLQPKVDLKNNRICTGEALVRWKTRDGRMLYPNQFIPIFEKSDFCIELDMYMFEQACKHIRSWIDQGIEPIGISVNQSKLLFFEVNYVSRLQEIVDKYQIQPNLLTLEILEDLIVDNVEMINTKIQSLRKLGFRVSLDDFGSGYSSLNILGKLEIDELKIDKSFLAEIFDKKNYRAQLIMKEVVKLAKLLSIATVVEGVETSESNQLIKSFGCDYGQGYFYGKPLNIDEFNLLYMQDF
ncbi:bifunctional diguanylate cyclase/phosphodiesterase [uncultured Thomasclavelia sp.]|uniref:putative bifunctional diguanylate cyclase/phosphodiesterase n=1 Tax=uncultured Thomasclavelia sp. TaxID=3025759 RepID=UPI0025DC200D|nr:bifunctional diguanylate cyclase/phosphodiesterase [uncultured Thomasclavelia sp.]